MLRWPGFEEKNRGQFFVISVVIIATTLVGLVGLMDSYGDIKLSETHSHRGESLFRDVKEGFKRTVRNSGCNFGADNRQPRKRDLKDFAKSAEEEIPEEGMYMDIEINETTVCDSSNNLTVNMSLYSQGLVISELLEL
ncbi:MAG: hypothetical protein ACLFQ8_01090 [Candidatus Aenigmatarchaeota archaeon]